MARERTIIVGAGGFGRELIEWARDCHEAGTLPPLAGLLDDHADVSDFGHPVGVIGSISDFDPQPGDHLLMAIGNPETKRKVGEMLGARGGSFVSLIHPRAVIAHSARIGEGSIFCPMSLISANALTGRCCTVNVMSSIGHDVQVGDWVTISAHVDLTGGVAVGDMAMFGTGAKILPGVKVGDRAIAGAGATVYRSVPPGSSAYATPSKILK